MSLSNPSSRSISVSVLLVACSVAVPVAATEAADSTVPASTGESVGSASAGEWDDLGDLAEDVVFLDEVTVTARAVDAGRISAAAHVVDSKTLEEFEYDDVHKVMKHVPGVYVREEDGYGLRPNIGLRGVSSDRSSKITLLEDGVLFGPAPYSAPAAYYFPLTTRLDGMQVFTGPGAIRYGPSTVGGAVDLLTRPIPEKTSGAVDVGYGAYNTIKAHAHGGYRGERWGVLLEGVRLQSDGFKQLDGGGPTGFGRHEAMLKAEVHSDPSAAVSQKLELKLGYSGERSHETYLGLSEADFRETPLRRLAGSANDLMEWWRTQGQLSHHLSAGSLELKTVAYRHDQSRLWNRFNGFRSGRSMSSIFAAEGGQDRLYYEILAGREDSEGLDQALIIAGNGRRFVSQGVQSTGRWKSEFLGLANDLQFGARLHYDRIERDHTATGFLMRDGVLESDGQGVEQSALNRGSTLAGALYLFDEVRFWRLLISAGARAEILSAKLTDRLAGTTSEGFHAIVLPGMGAAFEIVEGLQLIAGVHRGFTPVAPGQPDEVLPETTIDYEGGLRFRSEQFNAEVVGFYNQYSNLMGQCTGSSGCADVQLDSQFNGGAVDVYGLEATVGGSVVAPWGVELRANLAYTLTLSQFLTSFQSDFAQFGRVTAGDELPYLPRHQAALVLGAKKDRFGLSASLAYVSAMRDVAGQGELRPGESTDAQWLFDMAGTFTVVPQGSLYVKADNLLNAAYVTSLRPFGARPNHPISVLVGYRHAFGG